MAALVVAALVGCSAPPGTAPTPAADPGPPARGQVGAGSGEVAPEPDEDPNPKLDDPKLDDPKLAAARRSIVAGRISAASRAELAESREPQHRRATRLLAAIETGESPIVAIEPVAPEPVAPEPTPEPEPTTPEPIAIAPEPSEDDTRIDPIDARAYPKDAAIIAWIRDEPSDEPSREAAEPEPPREPFAAMLAIDEPAILLPLDWIAAGPRVILTRLELVTEGERVRLEIVGGGPVPVRIQPLAAHLVRLRLDGAGAVPNFSSARPSGPTLAVRAVRRGLGGVEVDVELAAGHSLLGLVPRSKGAALEFGPAAAQNPGR